MKIGIDLDDVVFEFVEYLIKYLEKNYSIKVKFEDIYSYQFENILCKTNKEIVEIIGKMSAETLNQNYQVCKNVVEVIQELSKNHEIVFITSRVHREGTEESLVRHFSNINYKLLYSSNPYVEIGGKDKGIICTEEGVGIMIEDSYEHSLNCVNKGIDVILISKPWNINCENNEKITRVSDWLEIKQILTKK